MACARKQGKPLCFCVALNEEGRRSWRREEGAEEKSIVDCRQESNERDAESKRTAKRPEFFLCLPPSSVSAAASATLPDAYSPRSLLSQLLLSLRRPSRRNCRDGGEEGLGCQVRFPSYCSNSRKGKEKTRTEEEVVVVEEKGKVAMEVKDLAAEAGQGGCAAAASVAGSEIASDKSSMEIAATSGKKSDELSLNLGMGVGLVFLLSRSATEINKMVELRKQMEILLKGIKAEFIQKKHVTSNTAESNNYASSASNSYGNGNTSSNYNSFQNDKAYYRAERVKHAMEPGAGTQPKFARDTRNRNCLKMDQMEAELEVELERLQCAVQRKVSSLLPHQQRMELTPEHADTSESFDGSFVEACGAYSEDSSIQCGVSAHELTKRLNQLLQQRQQEGIMELESSFNCNNYGNTDLVGSFIEDNGEVTEVNEEFSSNYSGISAWRMDRIQTRQQERIEELEFALERAQRKLREKEREICRWRDTARLVSQNKNEAVHR